MTSSDRAERREAKRASAARIALAYAEAAEAVTTNRCPICGGGVHRNLALTGWVQCDRFGAVGFRRDPEGSSCGWQGFTS